MTTKQIQLTNLELLTMANYWPTFLQDNKRSYPIKAFFYLHKNMQTILSLQQDIQQYYQDIVTKYQDSEAHAEEGQIQIQPDKIEIANREINELLALPQEITIYPIALDAFGDISLTTEEMQILMPMIAENFNDREE